MVGLETPSVISPDEFVHIARALFGEAWQMPLAKALGRSDQAIRQLAVGEHPIDGDLAGQLARLCEEHVEKLTRIARQLRT
jgi:hypothetical protein